MKKNIFLVALFVLLASVFTFAQTTTTVANKTTPAGYAHIFWNVTDIDSAETEYSDAFSFAGFEAATIDINGSYDLGTVATNGTYDFDIFIYGSWDNGGSWIVCDTIVDGASSTTATFFSVDLDDADEAPLYKLKATNNGGDNTAKIGLYSPHTKATR